MTSPIGNPLRIQFNGSRCRVGVVLGRGYGWMILLFLVISECLFLVQFGMILVQVNVLGYFWDGCPRAQTPPPKNDWQIRRMVFNNLLGLWIPILNFMFRFCWCVFFDVDRFALVMHWYMVCLAMNQLWYPLMPPATTGWFDPQHNQSPRGNNSPRHQYQGVPVPPWWKTTFFSTSSEHFAPGSASVAWGGGISLPRWNQGMVPWPFGVHGYAEGSKVILLFKVMFVILLRSCECMLLIFVDDRQ